MNKRAKRVLSLCLALALAFGTLCAAALALDASEKPGSAPIAENVSVSTYRGVPVKGEFRAVSPSGEAVIFKVCRMPKKGEVAVCGPLFIYTPGEGKRGRDSFTYAAVSSGGSVSNEATVSISIEKQETKISYADADEIDNPCAAVTLAERGIYTGRKIGSCWYFGADEAVTRGEFLAMCMTLADDEPLKGVSRTGFYDDGDMPGWVKPYVSAAVMHGIVSGYPNEFGSPVFAAEQDISEFEAAVMLNNALGITDVVSVSAFEKAGYAPAWAAQAVANLSSCNIASGLSDGTLTRGEAADMLWSALKLADRRSRSSSLLTREG